MDRLRNSPADERRPGWEDAVSNEELAKAICRRLGLTGQDWAYQAVLAELNGRGQ